MKPREGKGGKVRGGDSTPADRSPAPQYLRVKGVAERWSLGISTVYAMIERGELESVRFGASVRIPIASVLAYERRQLGAQTGAVA